MTFLNYTHALLGAIFTLLMLLCFYIIHREVSNRKTKGNVQERNLSMDKAVNKSQLKHINDWLYSHTGHKYSNLRLVVPDDGVAGRHHVAPSSSSDLKYLGSDPIQIRIEEGAVIIFTVDQAKKEKEVLVTFTGMPQNTRDILVIDFNLRDYRITAKFNKDGTVDFIDSITDCSDLILDTAGLKLFTDYFKEFPEGYFRISHTDTEILDNTCHNHQELQVIANATVKDIEIVQEPDLVLKITSKAGTYNYSIKLSDIQRIVLAQLNDGAHFVPATNMAYGYFKSIN